MVYTVQGNGLDVFRALGQEWLIAESTDAHLMEHDFPQTPFLGTDEQAQHFIETWRDNAQKAYYVSGNMSAASLTWFLGTPRPLIKKNESDQQYQEHFIQQHFAFLNQQQEPCGLMLMYRQDEPTQWVLGLITNTHLEPEKRNVVLLSGFDLTPYLNSKHQGSTLSYSPSLNNLVMDQINAPFILNVLQNIIKADIGEINIRASRLTQLIRLLPVQEQTTANPINLAAINPAVLFAENPTLDLLDQYGLKLSPAMLMDCLSPQSNLRKEIETIHLSDDDSINKNLLQMVILFYEEKLLAQNRNFLQRHVYAETLNGSLWNDAQIKLMPFLLESEYNLECFNLALSEEVYYSSIQLLIELGYTVDIPDFLADREKQEQLRYIHRLEDINARKLCLIFWAKSEITPKDYKKIVNAMNNYPLLAETLVAFDQTEIIPVTTLKEFALDPRQHQPLSLLHHFATEFDKAGLKHADLKHLDVKELAELIRSFSILKGAGITGGDEYVLALRNNKQGDLLRLFLPRLNKINNLTHQKELINILYTGVKYGPIRQGKVIREIADKELAGLATNLHERFICAKQLQDLNFKKEAVALAAEDWGIKGGRFRKIIMRVEEQCKIVQKKLRESFADRDKVGKWQHVDKDYRRTLYSIAFDGITKKNIDIRSRIKQAEQAVLAVVDPEITSWIYNTLIVIANILITVITAGVANYFHERESGNFWFFNQTQLGEQLRAMDKEIIEVIDSPEPTPILSF